MPSVPSKAARQLAMTNDRHDAIDIYQQSERIVSDEPRCQATVAEVEQYFITAVDDTETYA